MVSVSFSASMAPDRHVRVANDGEPVAMSVQSDGSILKVEDEPKASKPAKESAKIEKKLKEPHAREATIKEVKSHKTSAVQEEAMAKSEAASPAVSTGAIKPHTAAAGVGEVKAHSTANSGAAALPEGVVLLEMAATDPEESWKSAFFFFASLVLIVVIVLAIISGIYFNREQAAKKAAEKVSLTKDPQSAALQAHLNESSSTSDSGEKIAMLFDRVRKSLEDLSDKTPAEQADMAGGQTAPAVNTL